MPTSHQPNADCASSDYCSANAIFFALQTSCPCTSSIGDEAWGKVTFLLVIVFEYSTCSGRKLPYPHGCFNTKTAIIRLSLCIVSDLRADASRSVHVHLVVITQTSPC